MSRGSVAVPPPPARWSLFSDMGSLLLLVVWTIGWLVSDNMVQAGRASVDVAKDGDITKDVEGDEDILLKDDEPEQMMKDEEAEQLFKEEIAEELFKDDDEDDEGEEDIFRELLGKKEEGDEKEVGADELVKQAQADGSQSGGETADRPTPGKQNDYIVKGDEFANDFIPTGETSYPFYSYRYNIYDPLTEDIKSQQETRHGGTVKGFYAVKDADGTLREVYYIADEKNGFRVVMRRNGGPLEYFPGPPPRS